MSHWSPYVDNGGSTIAVGGRGYAIIAADSRLSQGFTILSRDQTKIHPLTDTCVISSAGMAADRATLHKNLDARLQWYAYQNNGAQPTVHGIARMLSNTLYNRRFFPIYAFNLVAGVDKDDIGVVYGYDAIGCIEALSHAAAGSGTSLIDPLLDSTLRGGSYKAFFPDKIRSGEEEHPNKLTKDEALDLIKKAFKAASERDIYTGDTVEFVVVTKDGISEKGSFEIRAD